MSALETWFARGLFEYFCLNLPPNFFQNIKLSMQQGSSNAVDREFFVYGLIFAS